MTDGRKKLCKLCKQLYQHKRGEELVKTITGCKRPTVRHYGFEHKS